MARFVFKLKAVLRQRRHVERQRQRELAIVQGEMAKIQGDLRAISTEVKAAEDDVRRNHLLGRLDLNFLAAHRRYVIAMERRGMNLVQRIAQLQKQVEAAQKALTAAAIQRKIIEKLRERQFERWRADQEARDAAQTDEIGMQLYYRNQHSPPDIENEAMV
ncbi:MAG TPA: flagellar export protein FliJ [Tepidisphaeraceae bacterium]|nr:flagellar export protein FliJ [Tepidisphaeraceae bacterium]